MIQKRQFFEYVPDSNNFTGVVFEDDEYHERIVDSHFQNHSLAREWLAPICIEAASDSASQRLGDFPSVSDFCCVPLIRQCAWNALEPLISKDCEALPVKHPFEGQYLLLHALRTVEALDDAKCEFKYYPPGSGKVTGVKKFAFRPDAVRDIHIFKLPRRYQCGLFIDEKFKSVCDSHGLVGLLFTPVQQVE